MNPVAAKGFAMALKKRFETSARMATCNGSRNRFLIFVAISTCPQSIVKGVRKAGPRLTGRRLATSRGPGHDGLR